MKNKIYKITHLSLLILLILNLSVSAQYAFYPSSIGIRGGRGSKGSGVSLKLPIGQPQRNKNYAMEWIVGKTFPVKISSIFMFEMQTKVRKQKGLSTVCGIGFHSLMMEIKESVESPEQQQIELGIDILFGWDYDLLDLPVILSFDLKPHIDFDFTQNRYLDFGLTIRYKL